MRGLRIAALPLIGALLAAETAVAAQVRVEFAGTVTALDVFDDEVGQTLSSLVAPGTPFSGSFVFDEAAPDLEPSSFLGDYRPQGEWLTEIGAWTLGAQNPTVLVSPAGSPDTGNLWLGDDVSVVGPGSESLGGSSLNLIVDLAQGYDPGSDSLASFPWEAPRYWAGIQWWVGGAAGLVHGDLTSLNLVPEPAGLGWLACASLVLAGFRRARR
jgi:hypothetical protein